MILEVLDILDDQAVASPAWLEDELVGPRLGELVAELAALPGAETLEGASWQEMLGDHAQAVFDRGLCAIPPELIGRLLARPRLLLDLQESVLLDGGDYWARKLEAPGALVEAAGRGWPRLAGSLRVHRWLNRPGTRWRRLAPHLAYLTAAAALLLATTIFLMKPADRDSAQIAAGATSPAPAPVAAVGWGWGKEGALPQNAAPRDYFESIAAGARAWSKKRPDDAVALARRLTEFRAGCSALILSDHKPLSPADREWLVRRCRNWAEKIDDQLTALDLAKDVNQTHREMDLLVKKMVDEIRERASKA
jgi:hypothetical protein